MVGKVGLLLKAHKAQSLWKQIAPVIRYHEEIVTQEDGTAVYILQARFPSEKDAELFKQLQQLSAEVEEELQGKKE
jgi:hypothetical protein